MRLSKIEIIGLAFVIAMVVFGGLTSFGETVSQKEAKRYAQTFFDEAYGDKTAPPKLVYTGKRLTTDRLFTPFYVYNNPRGGFVIIPAENKAFPILGYSLKQAFDADKLGEAEKGWLKMYADEIERIRYDSRVPSDAIALWQGFGDYVKDLIKAEYRATDPAVAVDDIANGLERIIGSDLPSDDGRYSANYAQNHWDALIGKEQSLNGSVGLGYVDYSGTLYPAVVHGKKGDFFRIWFSEKPEMWNDWLLRLSATEYPAGRQIALLGTPEFKVTPETDPEGFEYLDSYISSSGHGDVESINLTRGSSSDSENDWRMGILPTSPIIKNIGGGHFDLVMPEEVETAMVYSLSGNLMKTQKYRGNNVAHIDISEMPSGFYIALIIGRNGRSYGMKLYR